MMNKILVRSLTLNIDINLDLRMYDFYEKKNQIYFLLTSTYIQ